MLTILCFRHNGDTGAVCFQLNQQFAGIGPDRTEVEVWADPTVTRNTHTIVVESDVADLTMTIENVPSENPRTGRITALSVIRLLRKRGARLRVGS